MASPSIEARTLKGFRDQLPAEMGPRRDMIRKVEAVFTRHGFAPIDTPALEYAEILTGKYGDEGDKLLYQFDDNGGRRVAMRYDLTVPLARFFAQHQSALPTPFRRYHIGPVWRADKPQRGRFREFVQCDADLVGHNSAVADAEVLVVGLEVLRALGVEDARIHVNHRWILTGLIKAAGVSEDDAPSVIRAVDKLDKIGASGVAAEIVRVVGTTEQVAANVLAVFAEAADLDALDAIFARAELDPGVYGASSGRMREVLALVDAAGHPGKVVFDASIARGLDYYTGIIYETRLTDARVSGVGAVMSGGRYDHLIGTFGKTQQPAVGISLGLDRLLAALRELGLAGDGRFGAEVFIAMFGADDAAVAMQLATTLRRADIGVELATKGGKLGKQLEAADKRGCSIALVLGPDERARGEVVVKHLRTGEQRNVAFADLVQTVAAMRSV
jgi:histidyl-tRNA synthetase